MIDQRKLQPWYYADAAGVSLVLAYILGSRALDTGSLGQYFLTFVLLGLAIKCSVMAFKAFRKR